jgi:hypothetical protein
LNAWRPAWINDLQGGRLKSGVFIGSPGRCLVEQAVARLAEEMPIFLAAFFLLLFLAESIFRSDDDTVKLR